MPERLDLTSGPSLPSARVPFLARRFMAAGVPSPDVLLLLRSGCASATAAGTVLTAMVSPYSSLECVHRKLNELLIERTRAGDA